MTEARIQEHMEIVGSDNGHVGIVDHVTDGIIKLTKNDPQAAGQHHYIPQSWVETIDERIQLSISAEQAMIDWTTDAPNDPGDAEGVGGSAGPATSAEDLSGDMYALSRERSGGNVS